MNSVKFGTLTKIKSRLSQPKQLRYDDSKLGVTRRFAPAVRASPLVRGESERYHGKEKWKYSLKKWLVLINPTSELQSHFRIAIPPEKLLVEIFIY